MTYPREVSARLLDYDAATVISGALDRSFDRSFLDELNGYGSGSCSLPFDDPNIGELRRGRYVQIMVAGTPRFTFKIEGTPAYFQIDPGEHISQFVTVSGPGWGCVFEEVVVWPEGSLELPLDYSYRLFSFASINFPNSTTWGPAQEMYEYQDGVAYGARVDSIVETGVDPDDPADDVVKLFPAPIGFPWPNAPKNGNTFDPTPVYDPMYWVLADAAPDEQSIGFHFFRGGFSLAGDQQVTFHATGDNLFTMFLDGVPILGEAEDTLVWKGWKEVTLTLPAGFHTVGFVIENIAADVDYNPAGALFDVIAVAVYPGDVETTLTLSLLTSTAADLPESYFAAEEWPGWTIGQIMSRLVDEAVARGGLVQLVDTTWSALTDSEGEDWSSEDVENPIAFIPAFSVRIGQTYGDVLKQGRDQGWCEWHFRGDELILDMWTPGTTGDPSGVVLHTPTDPNDPATGNIVGLERSETKPYANSFLVQGAWKSNFTTVDDAAEIASYGTAVEEVFVTDAATIEEGKRLARVELARRIQDERAAILVSVEPIASADCPYEGFVVGDYLDVPQVDGTGTDNLQVLSIALSEDVNNNAFWRLEVNARWRAPELEFAETLRQLGGKTLGSPSNHGVAKD